MLLIIGNSMVYLIAEQKILNEVEGPPLNQPRLGLGLLAFRVIR